MRKNWTNYISVQREKIDCEISFKLNGFKLKPGDNVKYLGMYLDMFLSWGFYCHSQTKQLFLSFSRTTSIVSKLRYNVPRPVCPNVYHALSYSHLYYGACIWGLTSQKPEDYWNPSKQMRRAITFSDYRSSVNPIYEDLGLYSK